MNVLIGVPWDREVGGVVSVVDSLASYLREEGHHVVLGLPWSDDDSRIRRSKLGFPCYNMRLRPPIEWERPIWSSTAFFLHLPGTVRRISRVLQHHDIDVANVHYPERSSVHYALASRLIGVPLVVSAHGTDLFPDGSERDVGPPSLRFVLGQAASVVCPSEAYADRVREGTSFDPSRVVTIHNGVDASLFKQEADERPGRPVSEEAGDRPLKLISVGSLTPEKGHDVAIRAVRHLTARGVDVRLTIAGDGPAATKLGSLAQRLDVDDRVSLIGQVEQRTVPGLLGEHDIFVRASRAESFGLANVEAMAAGLPVVATGVGGIPEVVADGKTGLLVDPNDSRALADAIQVLGHDSTTRRRMGSRGRERVQERFLIRHMGRRYEAEFEALTEGTPSACRIECPSNGDAVGASMESQ